MAFSRVLLPLLVLCVVKSFAAVEVPVFIWGDTQQTSEHSALSSVPANEFRKILKHELVEDPLVVTFIEETLSVEDFRSKIDGDTSFPYLEQNVDDSVYLTSVENPLRVLDKVADPEKTDHVKLTDQGLSAEITGKDVKFLFINLKDALEGESREDLLLRHNVFMEETFTKLQERHKKVVGIYTAVNPSWTVVEHSRVRREADGKQGKGRSSTPNVTSLTFAGLKIYFEEVLFNNGESNDTVLTGALGDPTSSVNANNMTSIITFNGDTNTTLNFETYAGYWFLNFANVSTPSGAKTLYLQEPEGSLFAYDGFSYRCATNIVFASKEGANSTNKAWTLTFKNSRMQPFFTDNATLVFSDNMLNCVGFFTAPIWAGLFVAFVMLAITFHGITMMMDIRTMDRFDDPKGKTITINAAE